MVFIDDNIDRKFGLNIEVREWEVYYRDNWMDWEERSRPSETDRLVLLKIKNKHVVQLLNTLH